MTVSLEKVFLKYIIINKKYFQKVQPNFFKNPEINMVYNTIHKYMNENIGADTPKPQQIWEMVSLIDKEKKISKQSFKLLLSTDLKQYDEEIFIKPKLHAWILIENIKNASDIVIDKTRDLEKEDLNLENIEKIASEIREHINENTTSNFGDDGDIGSDFDDAEAHVQDHNVTKVRTGWNSLDSMLGGGFDISTLNIMMGSTNSGKCFLGFIYIRNKSNNNIEKILIQDFFKCIQKKKQNI